MMPPLGSKLVIEAPSIKMSALAPRLPLEMKFVPVSLIWFWSLWSVTPGVR